MKIKKTSKRLLPLFLFVACLQVFTSAFAEVAARDVAVDAALQSSVGGVLPPTGGALAGGIGAAPVVRTSGISALRQIQLANFNEPSYKDKEASVYEVKGKVRLAKKDKPEWKNVKRGTKIHEGDVILTGADAFVSITFDEHYGNVTHIPANTRAVIKNIEPTEISLEDGTIYNLFDALPKDSKWKVSSPVAVAAVRGTHFMVHFNAQNGDYLMATLKVLEDGQDSIVTITQLLTEDKDGKSVDVPEGFQIRLTKGQLLDPSFLETLDPGLAEAIKKVLKRLEELRSADESTESEEQNGENEPGLDPLLDTGLQPNSQPEPSSELGGSGSGDSGEKQSGPNFESIGETGGNSQGN